MTLTEEEAYKQECPFKTFMVNEEAALRHGQVPIYVHQSCAASHCKMAWRWATEENDGRLEEARSAWAKDRDTVRLSDSRHMKEWAPVGYCGLAGRPE